jgi:hypothetical protein
MGNKVSLEENLIDLKIVSKQMIRSAQKCEQNEKAAINKLKKVTLKNYTFVLLTSFSLTFVLCFMQLHFI